MKKVTLWRLWTLASVLFVLPFAIFGQPMPENIPDSPSMVTGAEALAKTALIYLGYAATIMVTIQGLKNSFAPFAALFVKYPKLGLYLNIVAAIVTQVILCLRMEPFELLEVGKCLLTVVYQIAATGGTHALYKAWLAKGGAESARLKTLGVTDVGSRALSDREILTPMREAAAKAGA